MDSTLEIIRLLNPWWKENKVRPDLAKPYKRPAFANILPLLKKRQVTIISGLRRVGKTTLLYQLIEFLLTQKDSTHIFYFNFDKHVNEITDILQRYEELTHIDWKNEKIVVFIDEIAKLQQWGSKIKLLYDAFPNIKFIISSSSSFALEHEAISNLAGRYFVINLLPLSFKEFLELKGKEKYLENTTLYDKELQREAQLYFLRTFPEIIDWNDELLIKDYLRTTIIDKIVRQDLPGKYNNTNRDLLVRLLSLFYSEPGMILDYDKLAGDYGISKTTVTEHIYYLEFSYLIKRIKNYRGSTLSSSRKLQKIYPYWWNLAFCYTDNFDKIMESIVASSNDHYWRQGGKEIDFIAIDTKQILPIEVKNKKVIRTEDLKNMKYFLQKFNIKRGMIVYRGEENQEKNIHFIPLWKWLLY